MNDEAYFVLAAEEAKQALCLRSRCGAVIVSRGQIIGRGYNAPPKNDITQRKCHLDLRESLKPKSDRTCCVHAEWRAIGDALLHSNDLNGSTLYFMRIDEFGNMKKSGEPYCTVCSRLALEYGIIRFGLWQSQGIRLYDTREYNEHSYKFHMKKQ